MIDGNHSEIRSEIGDVRNGGQALETVFCIGGIIKEGGDTVSTEAVATRRHAGSHLPVTWWKTRTANNNLALAA